MTPSATSMPRTSVLRLRSPFMILNIFPAANQRALIAAVFPAASNHSRRKRARQRANAAVNLIVMPPAGETYTRLDRSRRGFAPYPARKVSRRPMTEQSQGIRNAYWKPSRLIDRLIGRMDRSNNTTGQVALMELANHQNADLLRIGWYRGGPVDRSGRRDRPVGVDMAVTVPYCLLTFPVTAGSPSCSWPARVSAVSMSTGTSRNGSRPKEDARSPSAAT